MLWVGSYVRDSTCRLTFPSFAVSVVLQREQTSIQCLLHWRFTLNDNGIIRGNGTWGAEEDERLRKLAPVFSSPSTGPRYARIFMFFCSCTCSELGVVYSPQQQHKCCSSKERSAFQLLMALPCFR